MLTAQANLFLMFISTTFFTLAVNAHTQAFAVRSNCSKISDSTCDIANSLGRGVNLANIFEAPTEGAWGETYDPGYPMIIKNAGFSHVRIPIRWSNHATVSPDAQLDEIFARRIDLVIDESINAGLFVIINMHHYRQLDGDRLDYNEVEVDPQWVQTRAINIWRQVARRYAHHGDKLLFELYNEPHNAQDGNAIVEWQLYDGGPWNILYPMLLHVVRESNPSRPVIIGSVFWNAASHLDKLKIPDDRNIIASYHMYNPHGFTHQGVYGFETRYPGGSVVCCDENQTNEIKSDISIAKKWSEKNGVPLYVGEFGASTFAPHASRVSYMRIAREEFENSAMPWSLWGFSSEDFGIYDKNTRKWNAEILDALMGR